MLIGYVVSLAQSCLDAIDVKEVESEKKVDTWRIGMLKLRRNSTGFWYRKDVQIELG